VEQRELANSILEELHQVDFLDGHTHLVNGRLGARGLHDILLYHMVVSDLYAAGCPSGARLSQFPNWATKEEATQRIEEALPYLKYIQGTHCFWMVKTILKDLYNWTEPITARTWKKLDGIIRERADDRAWQRSVLKKARIKRACTEWARRGEGADDDILQYSLEWAFHTRCQWGEYDTALYELETTWGHAPKSPSPIGGVRPKPDREINTLDDVHAAVNWYVENIPWGKVLSTATHYSTDIDYTPVTKEEMSAALKRRGTAGTRERDIYASYVNRAILDVMAPHAGQFMYQFSLAAEPLPFETSSRVKQETLSQLANMIAAYPKMKFQIHVSSKHANQTLSSFCRELPNLSLAGYWWHNFYTDGIRQIFSERMDMLPTNQQLGFFSDAYCVEWTYAKATMVRRQQAEVLALKVAQGQVTREEAVNFVKATCYDMTHDVCGMRPSAAL